jgi:hypothetical protein
MNTSPEQSVAVTVAPPAHVLEVVYSAEQQLTTLVRQRAEIMRRIGTIKKMLAGIASLFGDSILDDELLIALDRGTRSSKQGFTPACRQVLMESGTPLSVRQASVELQNRFPELVAHHKDLNASVTTVFHRLVRYGQARCFVDDHGIRVWEWATDRGVKMPVKNLMHQP